MTKSQTTKKTGRTLSMGEVFALNLKGLMAIQGVKPAEMQRLMGIGETTYYKRLKQPWDFTADNMERAARRLGVASADMVARVMTVDGEGGR